MRYRSLRTTSKVQKDYDRNAVNYDQVRFGTPGGRYVDAKEQEVVASMIEGSTVLEIGTATGRFAVSLTKRGAEYTGVDLSLEMLRKTIERTSHVASVAQMDASLLGFRSHFDYALCFRTFHFIQKPVEALQNMFAALKPVGRCLITFETDNPLRRILLFFRMGSSEQYYYTSCDVEEMLRKAGFEMLRSGTVMGIPVTFYRKCPKMLLHILKRLEPVWLWPMHEYVLAEHPRLN